MANPMQTKSAIPPRALRRAKSSKVSKSMYAINPANTTIPKIIFETL